MKLSVMLNEVFKFLIIFCVYFLWLNYFYSNFLVSVLTSIILSALTSYILTTIFYRKQHKINLNKEEQKKLKDATTQFIFNTLDENLAFFENLFIKKGYMAKKLSYGLILTYGQDTFLFLPNYTKDDITESVVINAYKISKELNINKIMLVGVEFDEYLKIFASSLNNINFAFLNENDVYNQLLKPLDYFPENKIIFKHNKKTTFKMFFNLLLNKNNSKSYFIGGIILLFSSFFIKLSLYYIIFSSILFVLSFISFNNAYTFPKKQKYIFN